MTDASMALGVWQRHNVRLCISSLLSIALAVVLWFGAVTPDGRDAWYGAIAIEFVIWGLINLGFALSGFRGVRVMRDAPAQAGEGAAIAKAREILRLLGMNVWLNGVWLTIGVALLTWGYLAWSASLAGHGVGVLVQAIVLTVLDRIFERDLRVAVGDAAEVAAEGSGG